MIMNDLMNTMKARTMIINDLMNTMNKINQSPSHNQKNHSSRP